MVKKITLLGLLLLVIVSTILVFADGGGGAVPITTIDLTEQGATYDITPTRLNFEFDEKLYAIQLRRVYDEYAWFHFIIWDMDNLDDITAIEIEESFNLSDGDTKEIDIDKDSVNDIFIQLNKIRSKEVDGVSRRFANFSIKKLALSVEVPEKEEVAIEVPMEREPAPDWLLDKAKQHIVSYVGEEYFNEHISVKKSWTESTVDKIGAKYRVFYTYKFKIKGDLDETSIEFVLWLDPDGNLAEYRGIEYRGPQKPYAFNISRSEAEEIAKEEGLPESTIETIERGGKTYNTTKLTTAKIEFGLQFTNIGINESYIWYVATENYEVGKPVAVYIDVDSGEVLQIYVEDMGGGEVGEFKEKETLAEGEEEVKEASKEEKQFEPEVETEKVSYVEEKKIVPTEKEIEIKEEPKSLFSKFIQFFKSLFSR